LRIPYQAERFIHNPEDLHSGAQSNCEAEGNLMANLSSELVEISKLNGDFRKNYGKLIGAYLYLRSVSAARGRSIFCTGFITIIVSGALAWLAKHGLNWLRFD
jgi:hypothetical protein